MKLTHAIILAAGLGTRMRPLTEAIPKPLIPVGGRPLIDWCLDWLQASGIDRVTVNTSYLAEKLEAHLEDRVPAIAISREASPPLETGGGIKRALHHLGDGPFLSMNSDAIFLPQRPHPITRMEEAWSDDLDFLMLLVPISRAHGWQGQGDFILREDGALRRPQPGEAAPYIFTGVEIIHPRVFADSPDGAFSLSKLWQQRLGADGFFTRIRAVVHEGEWLNVGDLAGLAAAEDRLR